MAVCLVSDKRLGVTASQQNRDENSDQSFIDSFGHEWATFDYGETETTKALNVQFKAYCAPIDLNRFNPRISVVADFGAGSGRWASRSILSFLWCMQ